MKPEISRLTAKALFSQGFSPIAAQSQIVLAMPWNDHHRAEQALDVLVGRAGLAAHFVLIQDDSDRGPSAILNRAFEKTESRLFGYLAQDVFPSRNWLLQAITAIKKTNAGLLAFNDGKWSGRMASFGLADRLWVNSVYGGSSLFYPGYGQHFGDVELSLIAREQKRYAYDANVVMMEVDHDKETKSVNAADRELFAQRKLSGFDGQVSSTELLGLFG